MNYDIFAPDCNFAEREITMLHDLYWQCFACADAFQSIDKKWTVYNIMWANLCQSGHEEKHKRSMHIYRVYQRANVCTYKTVLSTQRQPEAAWGGLGRPETSHDCSI